MKHKIFSISALLLLSLSVFTGCGGNSTEDDEIDKTQFLTAPKISIEKNSTSDGFSYIKIANTDEAFITGYNGTSKEIKIPSKINGLTVSGIGPKAFSNVKKGAINKKNIHIPQSVDFISQDALLGVNGSTVFCETEKGDKRYDDYLENSDNSIVWDYSGISGVTEDGFYYSLNSHNEAMITETDHFNVTNSSDDYNVFIPSEIKTKKGVSKVIAIGSNGFRNINGARNVYIPKTVEYVGYHAFHDNQLGLRIFLEHDEVPDTFNKEWCEDFNSIKIDLNVRNDLKRVGDYDLLFNEDQSVDIVRYCPSTIKNLNVRIPKEIKYKNKSYRVRKLLTGAFDYYFLSSYLWVYQWEDFEYDVFIPKEIESISVKALNFPNKSHIYTDAQYISDKWHPNFSNLNVLYGINSRNVIEKNNDFTFYRSLYDEITILKYIGNNTIVDLTKGFKIGNKNYPVKCINDDAFSENNTIKEVYLPNNLRYLPKFLFKGCINLEKVKLPDDLVVLKTGTFVYCTNLKELKLPSTLEIIETDAIASCDSLKELYLSKDIKEIQEMAIDGGYNGQFNVYIDTPTLPSGWDEYCFSDMVTINLGFNNECGSNNDYDYYINMSGEAVLVKYHSNSSDVIVPEKIWHKGKKYPVKILSCQLFMGNTSMKSLVVPDSIVKVENGFCFNTPELQKVDLGNGITKLPMASFARDYKLESIKLPENLKTICDMAFIDNVSLKEIVIPETVEYIGGGAFGSDYNKDINTTIYLEHEKISDDWSEYWNLNKACRVIVDSDGRWGTTEDNKFNYGIVDGEATIYSLDRNAEEIKVPEYIKDQGKEIPVTSIGYGGFVNFRSLKKVKLPDSIREIKISAFRNCDKLVNINLNNEIHYIGSNAFENCSSLKEIKIPDKVKIIEESCFASCTNISNLLLSRRLNTIKKSAFEGCSSLTSVYFPSTVNKIEDYAFAYCENLESIILNKTHIDIQETTFAGSNIAIFFKGTRDEWMEYQPISYYCKVYFYSEEYPENYIKEFYWHVDKNGNIIIW